MADKAETPKKSKEAQKSSSSESEGAPPDKQPKDGLPAAVPTNRKGSNDSGGFPAAIPTKRKGSKGSRGSNESGGRPAGAANKRKMSNDSGGRSSTKRGSRSTQDEMIPCDYYTSSKVDQPVKLRIEEGEFGQKPITIMTVLRLNVEKYPDRIAYGYRWEDTWRVITYKDLSELAKRVAKGFISFGLQRFYGVAIIGRNSPEWAIANIAAIYAGGIVVPVPIAFSADDCFHIIQNTNCSIIVVGSSKQFDTVVQIRNRLTNIKAIIKWGTEEEVEKSVRFYTWDQLLAMGDKVDDERLQERLAFQAPNLCCTICHTSGTTGAPKAVMLSQDNFIWTSRSMGRRLSCSVASAVNIAMLSYAHVGGLIFNLYIPLLFASAVYFIPTTNIFQWANDVHPTMFFAPYIAFEELRLRMMNQVAQSRLARIIYWWAMKIGLRGYRAMTKRRPMPMCWSLANRLVYEKVRTKIGLVKTREIIISGRVASREALEFYASLNIPVMEVYGMTEASGPITTAAVPDMYRITSVGKDLDGCSTKILHADKDGVGELRVRGRNVFMGYLNQPDMTSAAIDKDGWLKTGDLARVDDDGFLYIIGKTSDTVTLTNGELIHIMLLEVKVREALPILRNCMVVGKGKNYLVALLTVKTVVDWRTHEVSNTLTPEVQEWFQKLGYKEETIDKFLQNPDKTITNKIQAAFDHLNATLQPSHRIQKWTILPHDFSVQGGETTYIQTTRRFNVEKKYAETIKSMYIQKNTT